MRIRWTHLALNQLDEIQQYIAEDNPLAAYEVTNRIFDRVEAELPQHPEIGRVGQHVPGTRELIIAGTPYIVVYRLSRPEDIEILRVRHSSQRWLPEDE